MTTLTKKCTKCEIEKHIDEFSKKGNQCKECRKLYDKQYNLVNKEKRKKYREDNKELISKKRREYCTINKDKRKQYLLDNKERIYEKGREYRLRNKEKILEKARQYRLKNRDILLEKARNRPQAPYNKEKARQYYIANKDKVLEQQKLYRQTEKGRIVDKNKSHKRRTKLKQGDVTNEQLQELINNSKKCYWCGVKINKDYHIDHYVPLSKGGEHTISNLVISCPDCNLKKNNKDPQEFAQHLGKLL